MLHVLTGPGCNNNCVFCMESDRAGRARHVRGQTAADIRAALDAYPQRDEVLFTSGEPTLNPELPQYVAWARAAGYRTIGLISNGRRLAYGRYAAELVRLGLNKVTLSIHAHEPRLHDALVRSPGAFAQAVRGLERLVELKRTTRLDLHTSTVVVKGNLPYVQAIHDFLVGHGVERLCFNVLMAKGRGAERFRFLMPRYSAIAARFQALAAALTPAARRRVTLADIPRCTVRGLALEVVGDQERFDQFERQGSLGLAGVVHEDLQALSAAMPADADPTPRGAPGRAGPAAGAAPAAAERLLVRSAGADLEADGRYYLTTRELKDDLLRLYLPTCAACAARPRCAGIWRVYAENYGTAEFVPLPPAALPAAP